MITAKEAASMTMHYREKWIKWFTRRVNRDIKKAIKQGQFGMTRFIATKYSFVVEPIVMELENNDFIVDQTYIPEIEHSNEGTELVIDWMQTKEINV